MSRSNLAVKQRYQNNLPAPPFPPKLVDYNIDTDGLLSAGYLSTVFLQKPLEPEVDQEFGMPIDLAGVLEPVESADKNSAHLSAADAELLEEIEISGPGSDKQVASVASSGIQASSSDSYREASGANDIGIGTSFLRRTAYMSSDTRRSLKRQTNLSKKSEDDVHTQLQRIEAGFAACKVPVNKLKHPNKPAVHAVRVSPLLPDLKDSDISFVEVRFIGSASLNNLQNPPQKNELRASVFYKSQYFENDNDNNNDEDNDSNDANANDPTRKPTDQWISLYVPDSAEKAEQLVKYSTDLRDTLPAEDAREEEEAEFELRKVQDNNIQIIEPQQEFDEIIITETPDKTGYFYAPVSARINLSRRRVDERTQRELDSLNIDILDLKLRELTPDESMQRDEVRSMFDPVTYG